MNRTLISQLYSWSVYSSPVATILTFLTGILFFSFGKWFGKANDIFSVFQVLLMVPRVILLSDLGFWLGRIILASMT